MENLYQEILPIGRKDAEKAFSSGVSEIICDALVRVTFNESDNSNLGLVTPVYSFAVDQILSVESPAVAIAPEYR